MWVLLWTIVLGASIELTDQEAYYWSWAKMPAFCYFEHPPLQAWLTAIFTAVFGNAAWVVRLPAWIGKCVAFGVFWRWARERAGDRVAQVASWILLGSFLTLAGGFIALPDVVMMPFAMLAVMSAERRQSFRSGLFLGLSALGKWTAVLLIPGIIVAHLRNGKDRNGVDQSRDWGGLVLAGVVSLVLQAPVLVWNAQHKWAAFRFHLHDRQPQWPAFKVVVLNALGFGFSQLLMGAVAFLIPLVIARSQFFKRAPATPSSESRMSLWWWILPAFLLFGSSALRGELRIYWTGFAFFPLALVFAEHILRLEPLMQERILLWIRRSLWITVTLVSAVILLPVGAYLRPLTDTYKTYDLRHSPRGDLIGWKEWVERDLKPAGLTGDDVAFLSSDFRLASQAAWAVDARDMSRFAPLGNPFEYAFWPTPTSARFSKAVFFYDNRRPHPDHFGNYCKHPLVWHTREIRLIGEVVKTIGWSSCTEFNKAE